MTRVIKGKEKIVKLYKIGQHLSEVKHAWVSGESSYPLSDVVYYGASQDAPTMTQVIKAIEKTMEGK